MELHRDFRSSSKEFMRDRNSTSKWKYGTCSSAGTRVDYATMEVVAGNEGQRMKIRPLGKFSDRSHWEDRAKGNPNIVKPRCHNNWYSSQSRVRDVVYAQGEIKEAIDDTVLETPSSERAMRQILDDVTYSFDEEKSPNQPLALDIFVKVPGRETERLVQREYEILDSSGEALRGRKARNDLRRSAIAGASESSSDEDGFEII